MPLANSTGFSLPKGKQPWIDYMRMVKTQTGSQLFKSCSCLDDTSQLKNHLRVRSHLVPGDWCPSMILSGREWEPTISKVPALEFGHGSGGHLSGHWVPVCTCFPWVPRSFTTLNFFALFAKMASVDGAKWTKDNLGTQSVGKAPFCTVPRHQVWTHP